MSRQKLKKLGIDLPLFPITSVGSLPKPPALKKMRAQVREGKSKAKDLEPLEREAVRLWIRLQEEIDLDVLVDGESDRGDLVSFFAQKIEGFETAGSVRAYGHRYYRKPVAVKPVKWKGPITVDGWRFAQSLTVRPVKGIVTGPYTLMDWCFNEAYQDRRSFVLALAKEIRKEIEALAEAGARMIQIDEPALSARPEEMPLIREALDICTKGLPSYFILHMCYGNLQEVYPSLDSLPVDNIDLELSSSWSRRAPLFQTKPFGKDLTAGVVDVHSHRMEDPKAIRKRVEEIAETLPAGRGESGLWIGTDCGLKTRTEEEAVKKLRILREAVATLRDRAHRRSIKIFSKEEKKEIL